MTKMKLLMEWLIYKWCKEQKMEPSKISSHKIPHKTHFLYEFTAGFDKVKLR